MRRGLAYVAVAGIVGSGLFAGLAAGDQEDPIPSSGCPTPVAMDQGVKGTLNFDNASSKLLGLTYGFGNSGAFAGGGGASSGKATTSGLTIERYIDSRSSKLVLGTLTGQHFPEIKLILRRGSDNPQPFLEIKLSDVMVSSYANRGGARERVCFSYAKFEQKVNVFDSAGKQVGSTKAGWDVKANSKF